MPLRRFDTPLRHTASPMPSRWNLPLSPLRPHSSPLVPVGGPPRPPFGAIIRGSGVWRPGGADALRRAQIPADPIRPRPTVVGPAHADLVPRGSAERDSRRPCLRVRLRRPGRPGQPGRPGRCGGRRVGRGRLLLRPGPGEEDTSPHTCPPTGTVVSPEAPISPHPCPSPWTVLPPETPTHSHAVTAPAEAHADAPSPAEAHTTPQSPARAPAETGTAPAAGTAARTGGAEAHPGALPERAAQAVTDPGELPAVPDALAPAGAARRPLPRLARPARHRTRGVRRRRAASALTRSPLTSGGTSCRNGLFSPSRWRPPASSCSS